MNLNDDKNVLLAKKAVYAEQLFYYSKLCQAYQSLAKYASQTHPKMTPEDIERAYAKPLSQIISSDNLSKTLHELDEERFFDVDKPNIGKKYSKEELQHFKNFAKFSNVFRTFQRASELLDTVSEKEAGSEARENALSKFHNYMSHSNRPKTVRHFDETIQTHSPRYIGSRYFVIANQSIKDIAEIDQSHIPFDPVIISRNMTPERFGAIINGYKTIEYKIEAIEQSQGARHTRSFDPDNWDLSNVSEAKISDATDELHTSEHSVKEKAYVAGSKIGRAGKAVKDVVSPVYQAHKGTLKKAVVIATAVAALVGGARQVGKEINANNLDINSSTQYEQTITNETEAYINSILEKLNIQKSAFDPQYEDVKEIEKNIDLVLDYVVKDQVTTAFEQYHEGYQVTDVESWLDRSRAGSVNNPEPYRFIDVSYIDDKGNPGKETISDFRSKFITQNHLDAIFKLEENIDFNSPIYSAFNDDGTKNYSMKAKDLEDVMEYLTEAVETVQHVAAFDVEHGHSILGDPYLKSILPEEKDDGDER